MPEIPQRTADQAAAIQARYNAEVTALRTSRDLTDEARLRYLALAYVKNLEQMTALQHAWQGTAQTQASSLDRDVFGAVRIVGADAISVRDAADRASRLEDDADAGMKLFEQAERMGDEVLAQAVAQYAYEQRDGFFGWGWSQVVDAYADKRPDVARKIEELQAARRDDLTTSLSAAFIFSLSKPPELEKYTDYRIRLLADA